MYICKDVLEEIYVFKLDLKCLELRFKVGIIVLSVCNGSLKLKFMYSILIKFYNLIWMIFPSKLLFWSWGVSRGVTDGLPVSVELTHEEELLMVELEGFPVISSRRTLVVVGFLRTVIVYNNEIFGSTIVESPRSVISKEHLQASLDVIQLLSHFVSITQ